MKNRASKSATWKTKEGKRLLVREMKTSHIEHCLAMLERNFQKRCHALALSAWSYAYSSDTPDGASMAAEEAGEQAMDNAENLKGIEAEFPIYGELCAELQFRKKLFT